MHVIMAVPSQKSCGSLIKSCCFPFLFLYLSFVLYKVVCVFTHPLLSSSKTDQVEVFYSTPSRYLDALNKMNKTWTTKSDDFFPYADNPYAYWTGTALTVFVALF